MAAVDLLTSPVPKWRRRFRRLTGIFATENGIQVFPTATSTENNGITIDGISTNSAVWGGATVITPSEDSVESVKVVSNSYDAEDGRFCGAQLQITSKSGTNSYHGSLFFTTHQPNLNAYQRYNGGNSPTRDNNMFNQFGGSVGGPIWKNKIFAFFNYETVRQPNSDQQRRTDGMTPPALTRWLPPEALPPSISPSRAMVFSTTGSVRITTAPQQDWSQQGLMRTAPISPARGSTLARP